MSRSPSAQSTPRQVPLGRGSLERNRTATCTSPLPPITTFDYRDSFQIRASYPWFGNRPGSSPDNKSPLSDYRRSYHPPPSFVHQSSSSSKSTSQISETMETNIFPAKPGEESLLHRLPSDSSRGSEAKDSVDKMDGVEHGRPTTLGELHVQSVHSQGMRSPVILDRYPSERS